jgi:hypothetical protein
MASRQSPSDFVVHGPPKVEIQGRMIEKTATSKPASPIRAADKRIRIENKRFEKSAVLG